MPPRLIALAAAVILPVTPAFAEIERVTEDTAHFTLENGLTGIVIEDHRAPVVTSMVWYRVGAADDPPGKSGLAHFLEHLMFKGTDTLDEGEFSRIISANGGEENAFTSYDYTGYFQTIAADRLDLVLSMEADRMANLRLAEPAVLSERDVVMEERRQVVENRPGSVFSEQRSAIQYLNHPYGRPVIGWMHEIAALTQADALDFYDAHYAPNNAILVVAGDVEPAEVERMAAKHFGPIAPSDAISPRVRPQEPPQLAPRRVEYRDPRVQNPYVIRSYLAPPRRAGDQAEAAALAVLADLLGGSATTSYFARALVIDESFALDAGAFYRDTGLDAQTFGVYVTPRPGVPLDEAEARLDELIERFVAEGPDPAALERVKTRIRAGEIYERDDISLRAREVGGALTQGLTLEDVEAWPDLLAAVSVEDVRDAARAVFDPETSVTGWLLGVPEESVGQ